MARLPSLETSLLHTYENIYYILPHNTPVTCFTYNKSSDTIFTSVSCFPKRITHDPFGSFSFSKAVKHLVCFICIPSYFSWLFVHPNSSLLFCNLDDNRVSLLSLDTQLRRKHPPESPSLTLVSRPTKLSFLSSFLHTIASDSVGVMNIIPVSTPLIAPTLNHASERWQVLFTFWQILVF